MIGLSPYAYCLPGVRQGIDQWFPRFMQDVHHVEYSSAQFQFLAFMIPFVASAGSLVSGYVSDTLFNGRRAPVAAGLYFLEAVIILLAAQFDSTNAAIIFLVLISFTANATHSILGTAAPMDLGGAKMAGFATGLIDSFQYFKGALAGYFLRALLDKSWGSYFYFMAPFGIIGGLLMVSIIGRVTLVKPALVPTASGAVDLNRLGADGRDSGEIVPRRSAGSSGEPLSVWRLRLLKIAQRFNAGKIG